MFEQAKILHVMEGEVRVETASGVQHLVPGSALALGRGRWCRLLPTDSVRMWTLYADETFLRTQMSWFLPDRRRVESGVHPHEWDGAPILLRPGVTMLRTVEPLWRQLRMLHDGALPPETTAVRTVELFTRAVEVVLPAFIAPEHRDDPFVTIASPPISGRLTDSTAIGHVGRAVRLLRLNMADPWTVGTLARAVAVSRTHLTRLFIAQTGIAPMRFLTQARLTEFTRLIEESDISVAAASAKVGWADPRTASTWFMMRFGRTPSQYRGTPHPHVSPGKTGPDGIEDAS